MHLTATLEREELSDGTPVYVALCRELDVVSQGDTQTDALQNLGEAVALFLEYADDAEIGRRFRHFMATPEMWPVATFENASPTYTQAQHTLEKVAA